MAAAREGIGQAWSGVQSVSCFFRLRLYPTDGNGVGRWLGLLRTKAHVPLFLAELMNF